MIKVLLVIGRFFLDIIETVITALTIFIIVYLFLFQPHQVKGNSMLPNFKNKEYLLTNKITYKFNEPKRWDVIIFQSPKNKQYDYIKRIIGMPGEKVSLKNGKVLINELPLDETGYLSEDIFTTGSEFLTEGKEIIIPEGQYFAVGDNRPHSSDSREWGCIPKESIVGKAWLRYWPPKEFGLIPTIIR